MGPSRALSVSEVDRKALRLAWALSRDSTRLVPREELI